MAVYEETSVLNFAVDDSENKLRYRPQKDRLCDITLVCQGIPFGVQSEILCSRSQYFTALFSSHWETPDTMDLSHLFPSPQQMKDFLAFIYLGKIQITNENIDEMLNAACHFLVNDLKDACAKYLAANLSPVNCLTIWQLSYKYGLQEVSELSNAIVRCRFTDFLMVREDTLDLEADFLEEIYKQGAFDLVSSDNRAKFLTAWRKYKPGRILREDLMKKIGYGKVIKGIEMLGLNGSSEATSINQTQNAGAENAMGSEEVISTVIARGAYFDVYAYFRHSNEWRQLGKYPKDKYEFVNSSPVVGCVNNLAIFDNVKHNRCYLMDLKTQCMEFILDPKGNQDTKRKIFCTHSETFLLQENKSQPQNTHEIIVHHLDPKCLQWRSVLTTDIRNIYPETPEYTNLSFTALPIGQRVFIFAQDMSSRTSGPYWMEFSMYNGTYALNGLQKPPLDIHDLRMPTPLSMRGWKHVVFRFSVKIDKIFVYGNTTMTNRRINHHVLFTYDIQSRTWSRIDNSTVTIPAIRNVPVTPREMAFCGSQIFIDPKNHTTSSIHGCTYIVKQSCPFVAQLWAHDLTLNAWTSLAPPPIEKLTDLGNFSVFNMPLPNCGDIGNPCTYDGIDGDMDHSPLVHWDLELADRSTNIVLQSTSAVLQMCSKHSC